MWLPKGGRSAGRPGGVDHPGQRGEAAAASGSVSSRIERAPAAAVFKIDSGVGLFFIGRRSWQPPSCLDGRIWEPFGVAN